LLTIRAVSYPPEATGGRQLIERSMIEGRSVLVTLVDDELRPVAHRCEATLIKIVFEDNDERSTIRPAAARSPRGPCAATPKHHERRNVVATPAIIRDTAIATKNPIANEIIKTPSSISRS
jgi:hypothetical protein